MNRPIVGEEEFSPEGNPLGVPQSKVYTREFDRECTAQDLIDEKGVKDYSKFIEKRLESVSPEDLKKLKILAEVYKTKM